MLLHFFQKQVASPFKVFKTYCLIVWESQLLQLTWLQFSIFKCQLFWLHFSRIYKYFNSKTYRPNAEMLFATNQLNFMQGLLNKFFNSSALKITLFHIFLTTDKNKKANVCHKWQRLSSTFIHSSNSNELFKMSSILHKE